MHEKIQCLDSLTLRIWKRGCLETTHSETGSYNSRGESRSPAVRLASNSSSSRSPCYKVEGCKYIQKPRSIVHNYIRNNYCVNIYCVLLKLYTVLIIYSDYSDCV